MARSNLKLKESENAAIPTPFKSTVTMTEDERKDAFSAYVERFQAHNNVNRQAACAMIAARTARTIWSITTWLTRSSEASERKHKAIPWATLDLLLIEEHLMHTQDVATWLRPRALKANYRPE